MLLLKNLPLNPCKLKIKAEYLYHLPFCINFGASNHTFFLTTKTLKMKQKKFISNLEQLFEALVHTLKF
jgi:hypothetical protein